MKIISSASARPNFVKLAAVAHAQREYFADKIEHQIVHTGQHYDPLFSDIFFEQLDIPMPKYNLGIAGGTRDEVIEATKQAYMPILAEENPDVLLVYGDVNGAVGAALAAKAVGVPVAHVEAGLRSFDTDMPEELNRIEIDHIAKWLFCTEQSGVDNIAKEGIGGEVHLVGNTMIDTLIRMQPHIETAVLPFKVPTERFAVLTLHRPSNVDTAAALQKNIEFINEVAAVLPVILPAHHRLRSAVERFDLHQAFHSNVQLVDPLGYVPFLQLVEQSAFILTDSGGLQEEAAFLGKRCFTMRRNTERPSTIESGSNTLIDPAVPADRELVLTFAQAGQDSDVTVPPTWDGQAGQRILSILSES